ncbi:MAG: hypothetical protein U5R31_14385 [Acidimicrobiia bacterium]|nr:hypothetical protein [Acidimicrobiia bacterium]
MTGDVEVEADILRGTESTGQATQDDELRLIARLRFASRQESPQLVFRVIGEDGQLAYQYDSPIGLDHRTFEAGEEATAEVAFRPAFGGGGTFRFELTVSDRDGRRALGRSDPEPMLYVPPRFGVMGHADLGARASIDGETFVHRPLTLGSDAPTE